jgi:hypothetical protein
MFNVKRKLSLAEKFANNRLSYDDACALQETFRAELSSHPQGEKAIENLIKIGRLDQIKRDIRERARINLRSKIEGP